MDLIDDANKELVTIYEMEGVKYINPRSQEVPRFDPSASFITFRTYSGIVKLYVDHVACFYYRWFCDSYMERWLAKEIPVETTHEERLGYSHEIN